MQPLPQNFNTILKKGWYTIEFTEFFTWATLGSFAGAMAATGLITQFLKGIIDKALPIPTRVLAYFVALAVLTAAGVFLGEFSAESMALNLLNAVIVATATSGTIDAAAELKR